MRETRAISEPKSQEDHTPCPNPNLTGEEHPLRPFPRRGSAAEGEPTAKEDGTVGSDRRMEGLR